MHTIYLFSIKLCPIRTLKTLTQSEKEKTNEKIDNISYFVWPTVVDYLCMYNDKMTLDKMLLKTGLILFLLYDIQYSPYQSA